MTKIHCDGKSIFRNVRRSGLTKDEKFRLWQAAIKDDVGFIDVVIKKVYDDMMAFDGERAERVMELTVKRNSAARHVFQRLLEDIQDDAIPNFSRPRAPRSARLDS